MKESKRRQVCNCEAPDNTLQWFEFADGTHHIICICQKCNNKTFVEKTDNNIIIASLNPPYQRKSFKVIEELY